MKHSNNDKDVKNLSMVNIPNVLRQLGMNVKVLDAKTGHMRVTLDFGDQYKNNFADYWCTTQRWLIRFDGEKIWGYRLENFLGELIDSFGVNLE